MKKTAILHYSAPPVIGGVESVVLAHVRLLVNAGIPVTVIAGAGDASSLPPGSEFIQVPLMDTNHPEILNAAVSLDQGQVPSDFAGLTQRLADDLRPIASGYDHLLVHNILTKHFNLPLTAALYQLMAEGSARRVTAWCHDLTWSSPTSRGKVFDAYPWNLLRTPVAGITYVAVSKQRQKETAETFGIPLEQVRVIYNGVEPDYILGISPETHALAVRLGLYAADLLLIMPVRVTRAKNIEYALELVAALKDSGNRVCLVVTGPPDPHDAVSMDYFEELRKKRHSMGLDADLRFVYEAGWPEGQPGMIGERTVYELLRLSDMMFMPSHHEGFGLPVLEAGLAGVPVVTSAVPAAREIALEDAFVFSLTTPADLLADQLINWLEDNPQMQLRRRIRREFTWETIFDRDIRPLIEGAA